MKIPLPNIQKFNPDEISKVSESSTNDLPSIENLNQAKLEQELEPSQIPEIEVKAQEKSLNTSDQVLSGSRVEILERSGLISFSLPNYPDFSENELNFQSFLISTESRIKSKVSELKPSLITFQRVLDDHNEFTSLPGYESIFYIPGFTKFGFTTLWKSNKFSLEKVLKIEFSISGDLEHHSGNGALVTILSTTNKKNICLVNTQMSYNRNYREIETFLLLLKLNTLIKQADFLIITGLKPDMEKILCRDGNFQSFSNENLDKIQNVKMIEIGISIKFRSNTTSNEFSRFPKMKVQKLNDFCVYYLGRLGCENLEEVFAFEGS